MRTNSFSQTGFLTDTPGVTSDELTTLRKTCDVLLAEPVDDGGGTSHRIGLGAARRFLHHRHAEFPDLERMLLSGTPARLAQDLLGDDARLFNEQFVVKGAHAGASFAWHQDGAYVGFAHKPYLTIWIALDPATEANGCVYVIPRDLNKQQDLEPHVWDDIQNELNGYSGTDPGQAMVCDAGAIVAFSSLTLHRSGENKTKAPRRAYIAQYSQGPIIDPDTGQPKRFARSLDLSETDTSTADSL